MVGGEGLVLATERPPKPIEIHYFKFSLIYSEN